MQTIVWGLLLLLILEIVVFVYVYLYLPLKRVRRLTEDMAEGSAEWDSKRGEDPFHAPGLEHLVQNLQKIDARITQLGYHVSAGKLNLHAILASIVEGVMVVDGKGKIQLANDELMKLFRLTESPIDQTMAHALHNDEVRLLVETSLKQKKRLTQEMVLESVEGRKIIEANAVPLIDVVQEGEANVVLTFHDITDIRNLETMRREFVSNVSHELRTPLAVFKSYLETLLDHPEWLNGEAPKMVNTLERHADRLNSLVEDLLTLSKLESGQTTLQRGSLDVSAFLEELTQDWEKTFDEKSLRLKLNLSPSLPLLHADRLRLEQVFYNLLENALNYASHQVEIGARVEAGEVCFYIKDDGEGIPPDKLARIFDRFYRVDPARSRALGGTGLGLSITQSIVELHGGKIWAESSPDGTTVLFIIPANGSMPPEPPGPERPPTTT